jgi:hypothetical protein
MTRLLTILALTIGLSAPAAADVWKWVDADGKTHFVDTVTPIYTWIDQNGKRHYSDTPDHEDAVSVELVWHSEGSLDEIDEPVADDGYAHPGETAEERAEREAAEAYYCKRATEIYESYLNAPRLYRTNEAGEREYLTEEQAAATLAETKARVKEVCG